MKEKVPQKSIKQNFIYNTILKVINIIFPLLTFPYIARVLSPEGVGKVDFSLSIIEYFILLAQIGIPTYAIRECAKFRDDKEKLSKTVQEILVINLLMLLISYFILFILIGSVDKLIPYRNLLIILSVNIVSTSIGMEWFYQAIEEYKYITTRSIIIKIFSLISVFLFINSENDFIIYGIILSLSATVGNFYNFIHSRNHINLFRKYRNYDLKKHIKPVLILFAMSVSISIYTNLDKVMLGFITSDVSVGLYAAANRMIKVILALLTSLGAVLLPRMSYYIENKKELEIKNLISKSLDFIIMISIPASVGIFVLAKPIILIFAGSEYLSAVPTIKILSPILISIAVSNLIGVQILISHGKEKFTLISTIVGALTNFILNLLLIPLLQHNGAAIGTLVAETTVTLIQIILAYPYLKGNIHWKSMISYLVGGGIIMLISSIFNIFISDMVTYVILTIVTSVVAYFGFLYLIKNTIIYGMTNDILKNIKQKVLS